MSANWPVYSIDQLKATSANAIAMGPFGSRIKAENFVTSGIPVIKGGNLNGSFINEDKFDFLISKKADELRASNAFRRDIVITHRGTIGQVGIIPDDSKFERYVVSQSQLKITLDQKKVNPYFVYYFLRSPLGQHRLLMNAAQVGVPAIARASTSIKAIQVPCPSPCIQNKVVEILLNLDRKIEINRQICKTLEQVAQATFKSWFVDFEPTRAKMAAIQKGQDPERAAMVSIAGKPLEELARLSPEQLESLKATAQIFPNTLVNSNLGEIPKGWIAKTFGDVSQCFDSKRIPLSKRKREEKKPGDIPYYGATSIMDYVNEWIFDDTYLLLGEDGSVVREDGSPYIQYIWGKTWVNNHAHVLQGCNGVSTEHLMVFISKQNISPYITGAVQLKLNQGNMRRIPFLDAGEKLNNIFHRDISSSYQRVKSLTMENQCLQQLKDSLLPKLILGQLPVEHLLSKNV